MNAKFLSTPVTYLKGVGPGRAKLLADEVGVRTYNDLLQFFPHRHIDRTRYYKISELERGGSDVQLIGTITDIKTVDGSGVING